MKRYINSLVLSLLFYATPIGVLLYYLEEAEFSKKSSQLLKESRVLVSLVCIENTKKLPKHPAEKKQLPQKVQKQKKEKRAHKRVKKIIEKSKKVVVKKPVKEPIKRPVEKPEDTKKPVEKVDSACREKMKADRVLAQQKRRRDREKKKAQAQALRQKQNIFFEKLRAAISKNKYYPRTARRRGIEGEVTVKFTLMSDGTVKNIDFIHGRSIFKSSAIAAVEKSFPIAIEKQLFQFPKEFTINLNYILH